eukprot:scaffold10800_cov14-Tisochrysis_lutea.AAC.2
MSTAESVAHEACTLEGGLARTTVSAEHKVPKLACNSFWSTMAAMRTSSTIHFDVSLNLSPHKTDN